MKVPYLFLKQENQELKKKILEKVSSVLDLSIFILGPEVKKFENTFAKIVGVKYAIGLNSGTDALFFGLKTVGIREGDEVITVANSFIATANVIKLLGANPIFVDIKDNLLIDERKIENKITEKTRAIIPVHLTGKPVNMDKIIKIAGKYNLRVIEDCAQAIGGMWKDKNVGTFDIGAFSLHPLKNLSACGDGGVITTNDEDIYEKILLLRNHGLKNRDYQEFPGYNSRLDELQAAILNEKIKKLNKITNIRRENAKYYKRLFDQRKIKGVKYVPYDDEGEFSVYHTFVVRVEKRDELQKYLEKNEIESKIHYPVPIQEQKSFSYVRLENTERFANEILSLPIHQYLRKEQIEYVVNKIGDFYEKEV